MKGENLLHIYNQVLYCVFNIINKINFYKNNPMKGENIYYI